MITRIQAARQSVTETAARWHQPSGLFLVVVLLLLVYTVYPLAGNSAIRTLRTGIIKQKSIT
jgi:hypothetical protein